MLYLQIASPKSSVLNFLDSNSFEVIISIFQRTEKVPDMERLQLFGHMQHSYYFTYMEYGLLTIQYPERSWQLLRCPQIYWGSEVGCISRVSSDCLTISMNEYLYINSHSRHFFIACINYMLL